VASPAYIDAAGLPIDWTQLAVHRLIGVRLPSGKLIEWSFRAGGKLHTPQCRWQLLLSSPELVVDAALVHQGIAQVALHHAADALANGKLVSVLQKQHVSRSIDMAIFYPHRDGIAPRVKEVVRLLAQELNAETVLGLPAAA
jgi:DNA-binding transcriptional LysR family regulator